MRGGTELKSLSEVHDLLSVQCDIPWFVFQFAMHVGINTVISQNHRNSNFTLKSRPVDMFIFDLNKLSC